VPPHFYLFAPVVYGLEVLTAVLLILGRLVCVGAVIAALQIANLGLGLYSAPGEWPWTYFFLLLLMASLALHRCGRSLGIDAPIVNRVNAPRALGRLFTEAAWCRQTTEEHLMPLQFAILYGSVREARAGIRLVHFLDAALRRRGHATNVVDAARYRLPLIDRM
jgi:hypothetical protein